MIFIDSTNVKVYPASSRGIGSSLTPYNDNPESKLNTENNIVELTNRLAKIRNNTNSSSSVKIEHSFVISDSVNDSSFEVCINGYYFKIKNITNYISSFTSNVYAKIIVKAKSTNYLVSELAGYDETNKKVVDDIDTNSTSGKFIAMYLDDNSTLPTFGDCDCYCLHILTKSDNTWTIPSTSKIVITADYVGLSDYNGNLHNLYEYFEKDNNGNLIIKQTNKLQNTRTLWGQSFDGTKDVSGNLSDVSNIYPKDNSTYTIGDTSKKFKDIYSDNAHIPSINSTSITPTSGTSSNLGNDNNRYTNTYSQTLTSGEIKISSTSGTTNYSITPSSIGSKDNKPNDVYATNVTATTITGTLNGSASSLTDSRTVTVTGDASGSFTYNGDSDSTLTLDVSKAAALDSINVGSSTKPVYFDADGKPAAISYSINKDVPSDAKFTDTTYDNATTTSNGLMSFEDKGKLDGISANANNYVLPGATSSSLGGVKLSLNSDGILTISTQ